MVCDTWNNSVRVEKKLVEDGENFDSIEIKKIVLNKEIK
jgi:hypothetical protein